MKPIILLGVCASLLIHSSTQQGLPSVDYSQSGANWKDKNCVNGKRQSPIDIPLYDESKVTIDKSDKSNKDP